MRARRDEQVPHGSDGGEGHLNLNEYGPERTAPCPPQNPPSLLQLLLHSCRSFPHFALVISVRQGMPAAPSTIQKMALHLQPIVPGGIHRTSRCAVALAPGATIIQSHRRAAFRAAEHFLKAQADYRGKREAAKDRQ